MCTYLTETIKITGSGKGADGWFAVSDASVYFDHPVHAMAEHTLNLAWPSSSRPSRRASFPAPSRPRSRPRRPEWWPEQ
jgi:hypothetical protein